MNEDCETSDMWSHDGCFHCQEERGWKCVWNEEAKESRCFEVPGDGIVTGKEQCDYKSNRSPGCKTDATIAPGWFCDKSEPDSVCHQVCDSAESCVGFVEKCLGWWQNDTCYGGHARDSAEFADCAFQFIAENKGRCEWPSWAPCDSLASCRDLAKDCSSFLDSECMATGARDPESCLNEFLLDYPHYSKGLHDTAGFLK